tara:strand:+ start:2599 stop:2889 length:291 start_codon:yes stop_codon:yes gene_type:complete
MKNETLKLAWFLIAYIFNFADAIFTMYAISKGAVELNPLMAMALNISPTFFMCVKFIVFALGLELIVRRAPRMLVFAAVLYTLVMGWHLSFWLGIL